MAVLAAVTESGVASLVGVGGKLKRWCAAAVAEWWEVLVGEREGGFSSVELVVPLVPLELVPKGLHQADPWPTTGLVVWASRSSAEGWKWDRHTCLPADIRAAAADTQCIFIGTQIAYDLKHVESSKLHVHCTIFRQVVELKVLACAWSQQTALT